MFDLMHKNLEFMTKIWSFCSTIDALNEHFQSGDCYASENNMPELYHKNYIRLIFVVFALCYKTKDEGNEEAHL